MKSILLIFFHMKLTTVFRQLRSGNETTPRPMTVVFGLGTKLRVRMRTTLENGVLRNGQQPGRAENSFIDQGELVAMKTLSVCKALRCDKRQFCD